MSEEKLRILRLLEDKKITSSEAMELLGSLEAGGAKGPSLGRSLRIRVYEAGSAGPKVNVNIPLAWAGFMMPFIEGKIKAKLAEKGREIDLGKLHEAIDAQEPVKLVDVQDGGDRVEIYID